MIIQLNIVMNLSSYCSADTGDNPFGVRATAKAATIIAAYPTKITSGKELAKLQGIGKATVQKVCNLSHVSNLRFWHLYM